MDFILMLILTICVSAGGGFLYLGRGGSLINIKPDFLEDAFFCAFPAFAVYCMGVGIIPTLLSFILATGMCRAGHGAWFDLGQNQNPEDKYSEERIVSFFLKPIGKFFDIYENRVLYDSIGLAMNGLFMTLPFGLALFWSGLWVEGLIVILLGVSKYPAYLLGWNTDSKYIRWFFGATKGTGAGEVFTGCFFYLGFWLTAVLF